ncbi:MAG TPA: oligosaccharide flippase family protein [Patescibacteria group bacterium]
MADQVSSDLRFSTLKQRVIRGFFTLTFRRVALFGITFAVINLILPRVFPPETGIIGILNIGNSILAFFQFFSDVGLAAALIQKKESVSQQDLKTTFTVQEILAILLTVVMIITAPVISNFYNLGESGIWFIRALAIGFFLTSLKIIPSVLLERELRFQPLVTVEIVETVLFNTILLVGAFRGFGLYSFSAATVIRMLFGAITLYLITPWKIGFGLDRASIKSLLSFGVPYQTTQFLALIKDRVVPLFVAKLVGTVGLSYITWAQAIAFLPLEFVTIMLRLTFPTFSRLQDDKVKVGIAIEKTLFATALFLYPALAGILALSPSLVSEVVSEKWKPALPLIYLFSFSTFWASISTTFTNALIALGKVKWTLYLMVMWTVLTWVLTPLLTIKYGFMGVAIASAIISFTSIATIIIFKKFVNVAIFRSITKPVIASIIMGVVLFFVSERLVNSTITLFLMIPIGAVLYFGLIYLLDRKKVIEEIKGVLSAIR